MAQITEAVVRELIDVVDAGLVRGVGVPKPGQMCVEAAVCYALGLPHGDDPGCVAPALRSIKIRLNDANWSSAQARARGLRRLAVAQLGSVDVLDEKAFSNNVARLAITTSVSSALRAAADVHSDQKHKDALLGAAERCEREGSRRAALDAKRIARAIYAATATATAATAAATDAAVAVAAVASAAAARAIYAATATATAAANADDDDDDAANAARDKLLADFAEGVVQILIKMKAPGCQWLALTEGGGDGK